MHNSPTRRSVMRASAWSVPVIAIAAAAPAGAANAPPCIPDPVLSSFGSTLRATNSGSLTLPYSFTQIAGADPVTMIVATSTGDLLFFNPDFANVWPYSFGNGAQVTYTPIDTLSGSFSFSIPAGSYLDFQADRQDPVGGCAAAPVITVTTVDCPITYTFRQCLPF